MRGAKVQFFCIAFLMAFTNWLSAQQGLMRQPEKRNQPSAIERAKELAQKGDWQSARKELEAFIKKEPENIEARKLLAEAILQLGDFHASLPHLRWLSQKLPKDPRVWATLGQVQEHIGQIQEATNSLRRAVHLQPDEPEFRVHLARTLIALDKWDDAAHHLRWLAHRVPDLASVQYHLTLYYERKGNLNKALHHAKRTVKLSPKEPDARLTLARIALKLKDFKTAAQQVELLTKQFPTDAQLAMECANLFVQAGDIERAIRYFRRVLHLQPANLHPSSPVPRPVIEAHRILADLYSQRNEWSKALWHVRWLARRFPDDPEIVKAEVQCYAQLGRHKDAERSLNRWANLRPKDFEPFLHLARLYRDLGNFPKARMAYDEALNRRPPIEVIAETAEFEEQLGDFERAAKLYEWAQNRQPENPQWRALRAEALMKAGKFDSAGRILKFALKRFPNDQHLNALMGIWHAKRVEWVEAEQFLLKGIKQLNGSVKKLPVTSTQYPALNLDAIGVLVEIWLCQGRAMEAVSLCDELLRKKPLPELLIWWAQGMDELGKTKEAAQRLERSQMFSKDERIVKAAARLWELANEPERAAGSWERFAQIVSDKRAKIAALLQASQVWERANQIPKALAVIDKALKWSVGRGTREEKRLKDKMQVGEIEQEIFLHAERIRLMLKAEANAAALDEANKLLAQFPDKPQAAILYAEAALRLWGEGAIERLTERWQKNAHLTGALLLIADKLNRRSEAEKFLKTAVSRLSLRDRKLVQHWLDNFTQTTDVQSQIPSSRSQALDPQSLLQKAQQLEDQNRIGEAMILCRKVIALQRDFLPAYELLLHLYHRKNDLAHAIKGFTQLANRNRDDLPLNFAAATALSLSGQYRRAITYWRRVCALTSNAPYAMLKLEECLKATREDVQAQWVRKFVKRLQRWEGLGNETN
ncbi:MAG: tetratricopeptide repeat protein [Armatimonadetes bacterium]|nr:tetratricopeptide repeat protein [Armatimonadota bacterium]MDW8027699.1 tetratricopeptide repeat protein [Armatimonadota bacterium]